MSKHTIINTSAGPIRFCTVWEFLEDVRKEYTREYRDEVLLLTQTLRDRNNRYYYPPSAPDEVGMAKSVHKLVHNPIKLITELKKTTTKKHTKRYISLPNFVYQYVDESLINNGTPTHLFCVGENTLCMVDVNDITLFLNGKYKQQLVCTRPDRNFTIRVPNLILEGF